MTPVSVSTRQSTKFDLDIEELINEVQYRPAIWNKRCDGYTDRRLKARMWEEVCENVIENWKKLKVLDQNVINGEVQKKWRNVKDAYNKEVQIQKKILAGKEIRKKRQYIHFEALSFLSNADAQASNSAVSLDGSDDESNDTSVDIENTSTNNTARKRARKKTRDEDDNILRIKREKLSFDEDYSNSENNKQNTDTTDENFLEIQLEKSDFPEDNASGSHTKFQSREYPDRHFIDIKCNDWDNEVNCQVINKKDQENSKVHSEKVYDEDISFAEMMVPMLRKLNDDQKHFAKIEILNILHKAKLHHSSTTSETQTEEAVSGLQDARDISILE